MKSFFQWVRQNIALSLFFGVEIAFLVLAAVWVVRISLEDNDENLIYSSQTDKVQIIAERSLRNIVSVELETFDFLQNTDYEIVYCRRNKAINLYSEKDQSVLIISGLLSNMELEKMNLDDSRLPVKQEIIEKISGSGALNLVFIYDNKLSVPEEKFVAFLQDDKSQDLVFQKYNQKLGKKSTKNI